MSKDLPPFPFGDAPPWLIIALMVLAHILFVALIVQGISASP
ncbi:hypothetical protein [Deinococcus sp. KSM4-11]|nr:hypothetical protein [Deinococcus sp. KSM4-11]